MNPARVAGSVASALGLAWVARAVWGLPRALGAGPSEIAPTALGKSSYRDGRFHNTEASAMIAAGSAASLVWSGLTQGRVGRPRRPVPLVTPAVPEQADELAVTWYGHASALIDLDGYRVLTDPVWSERVSPSPVIGPARLHPVPGALSTLPRVDAVVISHDHYDHLDKATVDELVRAQRAPFVVPMGIGAHLRLWGVPDDRIIELDWGGSVSLGHKSGDRGLTITCAEARHFSGRGLTRNTTLWASWALAGPTKRVYFGGDTGYTKAFAQAGAVLGPFDLTLLPIGAYDERWTDVHMTPEEAVRAHAALCLGDPGYGLLVPIHWATFNLAFHGWAEPVRRLVSAAAAAGTAIAVPKPGERVVPNDLPPRVSWWEDVE
ncbi:MBL fold metallo-hydrolase [Nocardia rosealba]|uniref:MBL fold metallo-hydrolase n=1 Tax=Nocardia TaxID=1817 RepID=UPI001CD920A0|nr:MBL fold metallo-hydrolase [Nocardia rosealba]MCA2210050.1 MBL fold metallo-hydrolase [Nocardia rosealba]